jgi:hypothetical protein
VKGDETRPVAWPVRDWSARLAPLRPRSLWVGTLDLVHLDAPVRVPRPEPLDPLHRLLLRAVETAPGPLDILDCRLGLGRAPLYRWLDTLCTAGLVRLTDRYALTPAGAAALAAGTAPWPTSERRHFTFLVGPGGAAHFLPWTGVTTRPLPGIAADVRWLGECAVRPAAWKRRMGFPEDVAGVDLAADVAGAAAWRRLAVATGERPAVVVVLTADTPPRLFAFTAGDVDPARPAVRLDAGWDEPFPDLAGEPTGPRADLGDGWALVGDGRLRRAVRL